MSAPDSAWQGPYRWRVLPNGRVYRALPITDEFLDEMRDSRRERLADVDARRQRGEVECFTKHEHLDVYGGSCDECRAAC